MNESGGWGVRKKIFFNCHRGVEIIEIFFTKNDAPLSYVGGYVLKVSTPAHELVRGKAYILTSVRLVRIIAKRKNVVRRGMKQGSVLAFVHTLE